MSVVYGYAIEYQYSGTGDLQIQVRIPSIHGPMSQSEYQGQKVTNYTQEADLPWYPSVLLPHLPNYGEVVALVSTNSADNDWVVFGLTGGQYSSTSVETG